VDLQTNTYHCGECNHNCNDEFENAVGVCEDGECRFSGCDLFFHDFDQDSEDCETYCRQQAEADNCNGVDFEDGNYIGVDDDCDGKTDEDVDLNEDSLNCGRCGNRCSFPHAVAVCEDGECTYNACEENFHDVDGEPDNGCEYPCEPSEEETELCNRVDDDCDGETDEGGVCL
jgi:hypothetical protein